MMPCKLISKARDFIHEEHGASIVEYAFLISLFSGIVIMAMAQTTTTLKGVSDTLINIMHKIIS